MSIAKKFEIIADTVYDKGKQDEYDAFWNVQQDYGKRTAYTYAFSGHGWTEEIFKPKYPIVTNPANNRTNNMFYSTINITEIMTPLYFYDWTSNDTFFGTSKLVKIGDDSGGGLWVTRKRTYSRNFSGCSSLTEIRFIDYNEKGEYVPSEIGNSISFSSCPLSVASMKNIIAHLVNYSGTGTAGTCTLTFTAECWTALDADSTAPDGGLWSEYVQSLGWNI